MTTNKSNNIPAVDVEKVYMPIKVHFNGPININLTYNSGATLDEPKLEKDTAKCNNTPTDKPAETRTTNVPTNTPDTTIRTDIQIRDQIKDAIVREFGVPRDKLISVTPFKSCYDHYAVGTTGDVTFVAWRHKDGYIHLRKQTW